VCRVGPTLDDAVTRWIHTLQAGETRAATPLWEAYFERLVRLALEHLRQHRGVHAVHADGEDVAVSAFHSFCQAASAGRFPRLDDRDDLWHVLAVITRRKAAHLIQREGRQKRGGQWRRVEPAFDLVPGNEPGPELGAMLADLYRTLIGRLDDQEQQVIAQLRLEGWTVSEVAEFVGVSVPTVERKLREIRQVAEELWDATDSARAG
jgi:RNA polymerase sigma factor (sigma-70 family)